jgi:hypothetical protein
MGYARPSNYELVKQADAIVLARAASFQKQQDLADGKSTGIFKFEVLERIKGDFNEPVLSIQGDNDVQSWGKPDDLSYTKPDRGPCNPTDYQLDGDYVLFLENWKGIWIVGGPPFSRINVLVEGSNAPWTQAVRQYARIAKINDYEAEKVALHDLRSRALTNDVDCPNALVQDIDAHFKKPTPAKSFSDLWTLFEETGDQETKEYALWACVRGGKKNAKPLFISLLENGKWLDHLSPVCSYAADGNLPGFTALFKSALETNQTEYERRLLVCALCGTAESNDQALMQRVLPFVTGEEATILGEWFIKHPSNVAINYYSERARKDYAKESKFTFLLARMGETDVLNWAKDFIRQPGERQWVGYYVLACSPLPQAEELARKVIQGGDSESLIWLVQGYDESKRPHQIDRVKDIIALKNKSRKLIFWLRRTLGDWAHQGDEQAKQFLDQLPVVESEE